MTLHLKPRQSFLVTVLALPILLLTGCFDAEARMTVNTDDTVDGLITVVPKEHARGDIERWQLPTGFQDRVEKTVTNNETGETELRFHGLGFEETSELISTATDDAVTLDIERSGGDQVSINGAADLQSWQGAQVNLSIEFPKDVLSTNGQVSENGEEKTVKWAITSSPHETIWATATAGNQTRNQFSVWLVLVSGAGIMAAALSALIAHRDEALS